jgi:hypothetical protein
MKIILTESEMVDLLQKGLPANIIPEGYEILDVMTVGYPVSSFQIELIKKKEKGKEEE